MGFLSNLFGKKDTEKTTVPSSEDLENAKKLFFEHSCNHNIMMREGADNKFKKYHISKEQETEWRQEFIAYWLTQLSTDDMTAVSKLGMSSATEALPDLIILAEKLIMTEKSDSEVKSHTASIIWNLKSKENDDKNLKKQAIEIALRLQASITDTNVWLSEKSKKKILPFLRGEFSAYTPEEYVVHNAKIVLAVFEKEISK